MNYVTMLLTDSSCECDEQPECRLSVEVQPIFEGNTSYVCIAAESSLQYFTGLYGYSITKTGWQLPMKAVLSDTVVGHIPSLIFIWCARNSVQSQRMLMHGLHFYRMHKLTLYGKDICP
jgi:hypothetical protein